MGDTAIEFELLPKNHFDNCGTNFPLHPRFGHWDTCSSCYFLFLPG